MPGTKRGGPKNIYTHLQSIVLSQYRTPEFTEKKEGWCNLVPGPGRLACRGDAFGPDVSPTQNLLPLTLD